MHTFKAALLTTNILFYPCEGDSTFFAALAETQQKGARWLRAQDGSLPFLANESHDVSEEGEEIWFCFLIYF